jgi:GNAT superfamily N-acetyltransferase
MSNITIYKEAFCISTDKAKLDLKAVHHFLATQSYWCLNIPFEKVEKAAANSLCFGLYNNAEQVGYARVITDYSTVAYLGDVYVLSAYRGRGLSKWLLQTIMAHPELQGLRRWILATKDAHGLYKQYGWQPVANPEKWMEVHNKDAYKTT